jgi:superfamily II DNA or RNA helicase
MTRVGRIAEGLRMRRDFPGVSSAMSRLEFRYKPAGQEESETFECYKLDGQHVYLPRYYAMHKWRPDDYSHQWAEMPRRNTMPGHKIIQLREEQKPWVSDVLEQFAGRTWDLVAAAPTGKGKTVMAMKVAVAIGQGTLIIVDQENLRDQWIDRLQEHLEIDPDDVGIFQGKINRPSKCGFTIAMLQSLYSKPGIVKEWAKDFGLAIFDECHVVGAPVFSSVLFMIPAQFRLGISATPDRRDAFDKVIKWHLGPTRVRMLARHSRSTVRVVENYTTTSWYANTSPKAGRYVTELAEDPERNWTIVELVRWFAEHGRKALILSDRINHLEALIRACQAAGIDESFGLYARYSSKWGYAKDPRPKRHPVGWVRETEYTPVCLQEIRKRKKKKDLEAAMLGQIIFATYAMFGKGMDLPALDAGLDATPRTFVEQIHGRILRKQGQKLKPIWITLRDVNSQRAEHQFKIRILELEKSNAEVFQWSPERNQVKRTDAATLSAEADRRSRMLKSTRIVTNSDGRNTLEIPSMLKRRGDGSEITIEKRAVGKRDPHQTSTAADSSSVRKAAKSKSEGSTRSRVRPSRSASRSGRRRRRSAVPS